MSQVTCYTGQTVIEVTRGILEEFSLTADTAKLCLAGSLAVVDISADVSLLLGDVMLIDHRPEPAGPTEGKNFFVIFSNLCVSPLSYIISHAK